MRVLPLVLAALPLAALAGCTAAGPENVAGDAGPAGSPPWSTPAVSVAPSPPPGSSATSAPPAAPTSAPASSSSPTPTTTPAKAPGRSGGIRSTDWADVTIAGLAGYGDVRFTGGKAAPGPDTCTMLPGGARPAYAEFLTEEPADSPVTEDALVLVECGSDSQVQMLVPVQLGYDQKTRHAAGAIRADVPPGPGRRMTFLSYRVEREVIVTTVRKADGGTETRRYRSAGGTSWERF